MRCLCRPYHNTNNANKPPFSPRPFQPLLGLGGTLAVNYSLLLIIPSPHAQKAVGSSAWMGSHRAASPLQGLVLIYWALPALLGILGLPKTPQPFLGWVELPSTITAPISRAC